ncbi:hypothetical protein Hanom_Chr05g00440311 [Helianthus anomalus]
MIFIYMLIFNTSHYIDQIIGVSMELHPSAPFNGLRTMFKALFLACEDEIQRNNAIETILNQK